MANETPLKKPVDDSAIQEQVAKELDVQQQRRLIYEQRSADQVRREAEDLLRRQKAIKKVEPSVDYVNAEKALLQCYK